MHERRSDEAVGKNGQRHKDSTVAANKQWRCPTGGHCNCGVGRPIGIRQPSLYPRVQGTALLSQGCWAREHCQKLVGENAATEVEYGRLEVLAKAPI